MKFTEYSTVERYPMNKIISFLKKYQSLIFCVIAAALFLLFCIPLFAAARYTYMYSDDLKYGAVTHLAIADGQPWKVLGLAAKQAAETYQTWQGSFSAIFLFALQPGIWGEQYYHLGIYIVIGSMIFLQAILLRRLQGKGGKRLERTEFTSLCTLLYLIQIFYMPYPEDCFYWFNGGLYYIVFHCLQLLLFSEVFVLLSHPKHLTAKQKLFFCWTLCLAVIVGGGNLATGLSTAFALCLFAAIMFIKKNPHRLRILAIAFIFLMAFALNIAAPGNSIRGQDAGYHPMSPLTTVFTAIWHCMITIYSWTGPKMWLILLIAAPILWKTAGVIQTNWNFTFRLPVVASILLFGVYASQLAPITYMEGTFGPKRMGNMMWSSYVLFLFVTVGYWIGWMKNRFGNSEILEKIRKFLRCRYGILQLACLALWCVAVLLTNVRTSSTYIAWAALRNGEAARYAAENEERLKVLHDPEITDVVFYRLDPIAIFDINENNQEESIHLAKFYRKNSVKLTDP